MLTSAQISQARQGSGLQPLQSDGTPSAPQPNSFLDSIKYSPTTPTDPSQNPTQQSQSGFFSRVGSDIANRAKSAVQDFKGAFSTGKSPLEATGQAALGGLNIASDIGGAVNDTIGEATKSIAPGIPNAIQKISQTPWGQGVAQRHQDYVQQNPTQSKILGDIFNIGSATAAVGGGIEGASKLADVAPQIGSELKDAATSAVSGMKDTVGNAVSGAKEAISPSLTPTEQIGSQIPNAKLGDIPKIQRTFDSLPASTGDTTKMSPQELSSAVDKQIQLNESNNATDYTNDKSGPRPMSSFETTVGKGTDAVTTNPVQDAIDQLKTHYTATGDSKGLANIKALETKASGPLVENADGEMVRDTTKAQGLTSQELDNLAKEHGRVMPSAFSKTGEPLTGLNKELTENTRSGVKATARGVLGETNPEAAARVTQVDHATSEAIHTQDLLDKQAETQNTAGQKSLAKNGKPNIFKRALDSKVGKIAQAGVGYEGLKRIITGGF